jgi:adenine-specific DNA-methyltransferase
MTDKDYDKLKQIEQAIQAFNSKKLYESSLAFYKALDYQSSKTERIRPNNFEGFIDSFNLPKNAINKDKAFVNHWKHIEFIFQVADSEITRVQSLFDTNEVDRNEYQSFLFFTIQLKEESYKRSELVKITRELNLPFKMPVIVLFHYGNKLTLSIIDRRLHKKDSSKDVLEKVTLIKDIDIAHPQRAHKEILKDLSLGELYKKFEFHSFVKLHEAWKATLNISELNKKFYKELAYWYFWALQEVKFPADELKDDKSRNPVNVIRLITRLIFVWFLKEKNLIPDDLFNKKELDKILDYKDKTGSAYYKAILQNLFFATLNTEMNKDIPGNRKFVNGQHLIHSLYRYERFIKDKKKFLACMENIPFLNGGLFECLDKKTNDGVIRIEMFSDNPKNETKLKVPDYLFFSDAPRNIDLNSTFHTKGKKYEVRGLIDILSRYKFTIEENTPVEEEVALDPELLGKVFENLLASYNEETETTARKLTGSFYTPREIVNYMVDESLITYLCNCLLKEDDEKKREELNARLHHLFSYTAEEPQFTEAEKKDLIDAIDTCKILDPACGSGAFPMGILHKLVFILGKLDPNNNHWKQKQQDKARRDKLLAEKMEDDKNREAAIKEIDKRIEDIEKAFNQNNHELDFARKLYLIENCIYGVDKQPVAIQISKLRFFIALIVDQKTENDTEPNRGIRPLPNLETKFVAADTLVSIEKPQQLTLMNQDEALQKEIKEKEADIHRIREKHFRARTPDTKEKYRLLDAQHRDELAKLLEQDGFPKAATKQLAGWNPYDQNKFAEFFDPMWMFEIDKGFDIVIGNPPYGGKIDKAEKEYYLKVYKHQDYQLDTYLLFIERGLNLLKDGYVVAFIVPNTWLTNLKLKKFRKYIIESNTIHNITHYHKNVFDAVVDTEVIFLKKGKTKNHKTKVVEVDSNLTHTVNFYLQSKWQSLNGNPINVFIDEATENVLTQIKRDSKELEKLCEVSNGIKSYEVGKGNPPQTQKMVKERVYDAQKKIDRTYRKLLRGKDIEKYVTKWDGCRWIKYGDNLAAHRKKEIFYASEKIVIRQTSDCLIATLDQEQFICMNNMHVVNAKGDNYDLKYILALINSHLMDFYYQSLNPEKGEVLAEVKKKNVEKLLVKEIDKKKQLPFISLVDFLLHIKSNEYVGESEKLILYEWFEQVLNGCVYELYFGEEMKKAGVDILALVEKDLESVKKLNPEKAIAKLYEKWQEPKNEVRNRLLLMATRCPDTIGVIEASVS